MSNISQTLNSIEQSVSRPIVIDIVNQIRDITNISKDTKILFPGDNTGRQLNPGSSIDDRDRSAEYLDNRFLQIEVSENFQLDSLGTQALTKEEHIPIFCDNALGVYVKPAYTTVDVVISFKYRTFSKAEAKRWRDDIWMRTGQLRDINLHKIRYNYAFPSNFIEILQAIHTLRENVAGYNQTFDEYFKSNASNRFTNISNTNGSESNLVIAETQSRIVGMFDFAGAPEPEEKDASNTSWLISFNYKISYERPTMCNMVYPIMIHNQLLDAKYTVLNNSGYDPRNDDNSRTVSLQALQMFELPTITDKSVNPNPIILIPNHDEFIPDYILGGTSSILFALCEVDADGVSLLNLNELGDIMIDKDILDFIIQSEYPYITKQYQSILYLAAYANKNINNSVNITCDSSLNVISSIPLNLRVNNRVRFAIVVDLTLLSEDAIRRLKLFPKAFVKIIAAINSALANFPGLYALYDTKYITANNFNSIFRMLTNVGNKDFNASFIRHNPYAPVAVMNDGVFRYSTPDIQNTTVQNDLIRYGTSGKDLTQYNPLDIFSTLSPSVVNNLMNSVTRTASTVINSSVIAGLKKG